MTTKARNLLLSILLSLTFVCAANVFGYDEDADSLSSQPAANEIRITPQEINIKYDDNRDTVIYRVGQSSSGGTAYKEDKPIIAISEDETITEQDTVRADIFLIFSDLLVEGYVRGKITVLFGNINVRPPGNIEGDIFCLGQVTLDSGVHVWGNIKASDLETPLRSADYDLRGEFTEVRFTLSDL